MKKKLLATMMVAVLAIGTMTGCGSTAATDTSATTEESTKDEAPAEEPAEEATEEPAEEAPAEDAGSSLAGNEITVVSREDGSGTRGAFIELTGVEQKDENGEKTDLTTVEAIITNSTEVMMTTVAGDENAIGYASMGSMNDTVKAVQVNGVDPTAENVKNGTYELARPFNIATLGDVSDVAQDFINFIMSAEGQTVIEGKGYIKIDENAAPFESNGATGKIVVAGSSSVTPVMEKLQEAYLAINSGAEIELQESDSTTGMTQTIDGTCDIGMASRDLKDSEVEAGLQATSIALDGIAVIVNNANNVNDLSTDDIAAIFKGERLEW
ncbi:MAG: substrate-binding domain-containing protein [Eubacterium sp.]|nr:substrate-binding domain-containing protein [Eubacterium sp.]